MYRTLRNTHLILGLLSIPFLLIYGISAVQMAHKLDVDRQLSAVEFSVQPGLQPRPLAKLVMEKQRYTGEFAGLEDTPAGFRFTITSAGAQHQVFYTSKQGRVRVRTTSVGVLGVLNRLHHFHGLKNETWPRNAWSVALACVSVILLFLGLSGIYLWFKLHTERSLGLWLLMTNLCIAGTLIAALRW